MQFLKRYREPELKELTIEERLHQATADVERAVKAIEALRTEYKCFQASNKLTMDVWGNILTLAVADPAQRPVYEDIARNLTQRIARAEQDFYNKLRAWSGLKCQLEINEQARRKED